MNNKRISKKYVMTVDPLCADDMFRLDLVKKTIANANNCEKDRVRHSPQSANLLRVQLRGRLGKNNPRSARYKKPGLFRLSSYSYIRLADAVRYDVYVYKVSKSFQ